MSGTTYKPEGADQMTSEKLAFIKEQAHICQESLNEQSGNLTQRANQVFAFLITAAIALLGAGLSKFGVADSALARPAIVTAVYLWALALFLLNKGMKSFDYPYLGRAPVDLIGKEDDYHWMGNTAFIEHELKRKQLDIDDMLKVNNQRGEAINRAITLATYFFVPACLVELAFGSLLTW